jgi:hypothetical protein
MYRRTCLVAVGALLTFVALPLRANACSMCQCGDPTYRLMGDDFFAAHSFRASLDVDRHSKDQVLEGDPTGREKETENRLTLSGSWQPLPRLRFVGRVPYVQRTIEIPVGESKLSGLGDPDLFAHFNLLESGNAASGWWLAAMAGVKSPWGSRHVGAEEHLQPGSGATSLFAGLAYAHGIGGGAHVYTSVMGRWNGTNADHYRYGDVLLANLAVLRAFASSVSGSLELNYRASNRDRSAGDDGMGALDPNTGGSVLYLSPKGQFTLASPVGLQLGVQIPVARNLNGDQREFANFESGLVFAF